MRKIFLLLGLSAMFAQCGQIKGNEYLIKGKTGNTQAVMAFLSRGAEVIDSVAVSNGEFQFRGTVDEPFLAAVDLSDNHDKPARNDRGVDRKSFYIEQGKITLISRDSLENAEVTGGAVNADAAKWRAVSKPVSDSIRAYMDRYNKARTVAKVSGVANDSLLDSYRVVIDSLQRYYNHRLGLDFIVNNPESYYALQSLYSQVTGYPPTADRADSILKLFSPKLAETGLGKKYQKQIDNLRAVATGKIAPDFEQADSTGKILKLSDFRGKYLLIDFWASWCGPCRHENPNVVAAYQQFKDKGFTILGVSLDDDRAKWLEAIDKDKLDWAQVSDLKGWRNEVAELYVIKAIPSNLLLDRDGKIVERDLRGEDLAATLAKYLNN
jgi:peroxiredoxin